MATVGARESEVDHRLLVEHSVDVIFQVRQMKDGKMRYEYVSPSVVDVLGWTAKEMEHVTHSTVYPPTSLAVIQEAGQRLVEGAHFTVVTVEAIRKDGTHIWVENHVRMIAEVGPQDHTVVVCMRNVTERKLLQDRLARLVWIDDLTGVGNRRAFDTALDEAWKTSLESHTALSLALLDIDHFKKINDTLGHPVGDDCIRHVAAQIKSFFTGSEVFVGRYGGDELVLLMPRYDEAAVQEVTKRICLLVARVPLQAQSAPSIGKLTISSGATTLLGLPVPCTLTKSSFIQTADQALYIAKRSGRNQTVFLPFPNGRKKSAAHHETSPTKVQSS